MLLSQPSRGVATRLGAAFLRHQRLLSQGLATASKQVNVEIQDEIAVIRLNDPDKAVNTLNEGLIIEFREALDTLSSNSQVKAGVLISDKPGCFIAGADIGMLNACTTEEQMRVVSEEGQNMLNQLESLKTPIVAAINGSCLGGGLEVAMACHHRIATSDPKTKLGLPEVQLGLLPGAGGTQRLPRLVGMMQGIQMMTTGKQLKADKAKKMGLVDAVADPNALEAAAMAAARQLAAGTLKPVRSSTAVPKKRSAADKVMESFLGRKFVFNKAKETVTKMSGGKYPAPYKILDSIQAGYDGGFKAGLKAEAAGFAQLGMTPESAALQGIFFSMQHTKKNHYGKPQKPVETIGVLGAGLMGAGIAQVSAQSGYRVLLKDKDEAGLARGEAVIGKELAKKVKRKNMSSFQRDKLLSNVVGLTDDTASWPTHFGNCDMVIEAVFEDMGLKHKIIEQMETMVPDHCVIGSNTSALPIGQIASVARLPERVVGMHYFSPVPVMQLVEIITHDKTSKEAAAAACAVGIKQGKSIIVCKDVPGFYVNRSLGPYIVESMALLQAGVPISKLDKALKDFGYPMGPMTLADMVGLDVAMKTTTTVAGDLGVRMEGADLQMMHDLTAAGYLGQKTGKGFFTYSASKGKSKSPPQVNAEVEKLISGYVGTKSEVSVEDIQMRMVGRFVNEAIFCLQDEIIQTPADGDIGAVFGLGFPPFLGGPFRWVDLIGPQTFVDMMFKYRDAHGEQFTPAQLVQDLAKGGKKFH